MTIRNEPNSSYTEGIDVSKMIEITFTVYNAYKHLKEDGKIYKVMWDTKQEFPEYEWSVIVVTDVPESMTFDKRVILDIKCAHTLGVYGFKC